MEEVDCRRNLKVIYLCSLFHFEFKAIDIKKIENVLCDK